MSKLDPEAHREFFFSDRMAASQKPDVFAEITRSVVAA